MDAQPWCVCMHMYMYMYACMYMYLLNGIGMRARMGAGRDHILFSMGSQVFCTCMYMCMMFVWGAGHSLVYLCYAMHILNMK